MSDVDVALSKLAYWRREIDNLYAGQPHHPVTQALSPHIAPLHLPQTALHTVVDGMQQDIDKSRYLNFDELSSYCYKAAGVVGEVSARIFGIARTNNPATLEYARTLGEALQLTNIIRDVGEDARRNRIYLPQEDLDRFGVSSSSLLRASRAVIFRRSCVSNSNGQQELMSGPMHCSRQKIAGRNGRAWRWQQSIAPCSTKFGMMAFGCSNIVSR